jgi:sulfoxide reductase heme-binding subunit YedZ
MWKSPWSARLIFLACLLPLFWLSWKSYHNELGINSIEYVSRYTGKWTLRLLLITLAITPLRRVPGLNPLIRFRRMLGLFTFFYGSLHALHYFAMDVQWHWQVIVEDLTFRRFFIAGAIALALMAPLALTSSNAAIRWMGGRRWQRLHRLIYLSAVAAIVHYVWQGKSLTLPPLIYAGILALLLALRAVFAVLRWRRSPQRA